MRLFLLLTLLLGSTLLQAQTSQDVTVALSANVTVSPASIQLNWSNPTASAISIKRRLKGAGSGLWTNVFSETNSLSTTFTDINILEGKTYEYSIKRTAGTLTAYGYAHVAVLEPLVDYRGKLLIFIDSTTADLTGVELKLFEDGIRGDGWQTVPIKTGPASTVQSIKNKIIELYNADPTNVKAVLLIGDVPIPYSGNFAWDGHPDHNGAWPSDNYYADVNGLWTDNQVNTTNPSRDANDNVPGDGKFDQSYIPSPAELMVGRIDFRHLSPATFGATPTELIKRYFIKNHLWRTGQYRVSQKALVDDNFGYFGGEAFASSGYRNAYPLVGESNVVNADFLNDTDTSSYLLGYGCGAGSYDSAAGIGNSTQIANDSINIVFFNIFGSYHGDWDYENTPLMPSILASKGGVLTCAWAGRPHWFMQALASGETIGYCTKETVNAQYNTEYPNSTGRSGAHVALLGDPTVRAHIVAQVEQLTFANTCSTVILNWTAAPDTGIIGYHIYRADNIDGPYLRLSTNLVSTLTWEDITPPNGQSWYQVRAVRIDSAPGGGLFYNNSSGIIRTNTFTASPLVNITVSNEISCSTPESTLNATAQEGFVGTLYWHQDDVFFLNNPIQVSFPAMYELIVTDNTTGCSFYYPVEVKGDFETPTIFATQTNSQLTCTVTEVPFFATISSSSPYSTVWTGPGDFGPANQFIQEPGVYCLVATTISSGCSSSYCLTVTQNTPNIVVPAVSTGCIDGSSNGTIQVTPIPANFSYTYLWNTGAITPNLSGLAPSVYTVTVTDVQSGCTAENTIEVALISGTQENASINKQVVSPNPAHESVTSTLEMNSTQSIRATLTDANGRIIYFKQHDGAQQHQFQFDTSQLPEGIYFLWFYTETGVSFEKVLVHHP